MVSIWVNVISVSAVCLLLAPDVHSEPPMRPALQMETVLIRGDEFTMGTPIEKGEPEYHEDESQQTVTVTDFRIGRFPVTAEQMCAFLNSEQARNYDRIRLYNHKNVGEFAYSTIALIDGRFAPREGAADAPANQVTWMGAVLFCRWLSDETGRTYRLPSEAEWELAARGTDARHWPWGDDEPTAEHGRRYYRWQQEKRGAAYTWPRVSVGSHPANATPEGVHDMLAYFNGEWCANRYLARPSPEQLADPSVDLDDERNRRVQRGYDRRYYPRRGRLLRLTEYGWRSHLGRPWTRVGCPVSDVRYAAGFRVVEEVEMRSGK